MFYRISRITPLALITLALFSGSASAAHLKNAFTDVASSPHEEAKSLMNINALCAVMLEDSTRLAEHRGDAVINETRSAALMAYLERQVNQFSSRKDVSAEEKSLFEKTAAHKRAREEFERLDYDQKNQLYSMCVPRADATLIQLGHEPGPPPVADADKRGKPVDAKRWENIFGNAGLCYALLHDTDGPGSEAARGAQRAWVFLSREYAFDPSMSDKSRPTKAFKQGLNYFKNEGWTRDGKSKGDILNFCRKETELLQAQNHHFVVNRIKKFEFPKQDPCGSSEYSSVSEIIIPSSEGNREKAIRHNKQLLLCTTKQYLETESYLRYLVRSTGGFWDGVMGGEFVVWAPVGYDPKERISERIGTLVEKLKERRARTIAFQNEIKKTIASLEKKD